MITAILANRSATISELKKSDGDSDVSRGRPVAILNHSKPSFYCIPAELYAAMLDAIEDRELANIVRSRQDEDEVDVSWENL